MKKEWYSCKFDKKKLLMIDADKNIEGVFIQCPVCKREIEIINKPRAGDQRSESMRPEPRVQEPVITH